MTLATAIVLDVLIIAGLTGLGVALARLVLARPGVLELAALGFPLGSGAFTWLLFLLSWAGIPLEPASILSAYALALALLVLLIRIRRRTRPVGRAEPASTDQQPRPRWHRAGLVAVVLLFAAVIVPLAVLRAHSYWDAAAGWIVKGYGIALEGDIRAAESWGAWGLSYPLNIPLQATLFRVFDTDRLPGSMLVFPIYAISLALGVYRFWRNQRVGEWRSLAGMLLLLSNPIFLLHSSVGYANLPTTAYVVLGACWMIEGLIEDRRPEVVMGSLLLGLAGWTRPEAMSYGLILLPSLLVLVRIMRKRWGSWRDVLLPFAALVGIWFVFGATAVGESHLGGAVRGVLPAMQAGEFRLFELYLIPRLLAARALQPRIWGYLFQAAAVLCLVGLPRLVRRRASLQQWAVTLSTAAFAAIPVGIFYVRSFTLQRDFIPLLNRSFDRAFLPGATMLLVLGVMLALAEPPAANARAGSAEGT